MEDTSALQNIQIAIQIKMEHARKENVIDKHNNTVTALITISNYFQAAAARHFWEAGSREL